MDVLLNWLEQRANYKRDRQAIQDAFDSQNQYGEYLGVEFDNSLEKINTIIKSTSQKQGWSQPQGKYQGNNYNQKRPPLRELILEQVRINENIHKKLVFNDAILEGINSKLDNFSSALKEQIAFNKKIELQIAHLASTLSATANLEQVK
jgi:hypothetical protein